MVGLWLNTTELQRFPYVKPCTLFLLLDTLMALTLSEPTVYVAVRVEIEHYSVAYFNHVTAFEAL